MAGSNDWVQITKEQAEKHPLYGVRGWPILLLIGLIIGPPYSWGMMGQVFGVPSGLADTLVFYGPGLFAWFVAALLLLKNKIFVPFFYGLAIAAPFFSLINLEAANAAMPNAGSQMFVLAFVQAVVWCVYVFRSKRINVTYGNRVGASDPYLASLDKSSGAAHEISDAHRNPAGTQDDDVRVSKAENAAQASPDRGLSGAPETPQQTTNPAPAHPTADEEVPKHQSEPLDQPAPNSRVTEGSGKTVQQKEDAMPADIEDDFAVLLEYDPSVKSAYMELKPLGQDYAKRFREQVVADRHKSYEIGIALAKEWEAARNKELWPYTSDGLNDALARARELGPGAEAEFKKVIDVMGEDVHPETIVAKIEKKFSSPSEQETED